MQPIHTTRTLFAVFLMILLMIATRGHENWLTNVVHLPDFTIPALLIAGIYLRQVWVALVIIISAVAIDNYAIVYDGVSAHCITPAYSVLLLSYAGIFWVGKHISGLSFDTRIVTVSSVTKDASIIILAVTTQWLIATTSYYFWTLAYANTGWTNFPAYAQQWALGEIASVLYWIGAIMVVWTLNQRYSLAARLSLFKHSKD